MYVRPVRASCRAWMGTICPALGDAVRQLLFLVNGGHLVHLLKKEEISRGGDDAEDEGTNDEGIRTVELLCLLNSRWQFKSAILACFFTSYVEPISLFHE